MEEDLCLKTEQANNRFIFDGYVYLYREYGEMEVGCYGVKVENEDSIVLVSLVRYNRYLTGESLTPAEMHQFRNDIYGCDVILGSWTNACFPNCVNKPLYIPHYSRLGIELNRIVERKTEK